MLNDAQITNQVIVYIVLAFAIACAVSYFISPLVMKFAKLVGAVDVPKDERRMHKTPLTRLGGLSIFLGFIIAVLIFNDISIQVAGILTGSVIIVVLGVLDDIYRLKAWVKLIVQIAAALIPVFCDVVVHVLSNPLYIFGIGGPYLELGIWAYPITAVWIIVITNSVNLIDGLDGLAVGVSSIASISMLIIAVVLPTPYVAILMAALAGGCMGFMPFNLNPAKMFMGDTGATFLGYILATTSILGLFKLYAIISFAVPFLVLGLPIFDTVSAILRRLSKGKSPMSADRGHVHHKLIDMGFTQKQSVAILYLMSALLGITAVVLTTAGEIKALILLASVLFGASVAVGLFVIGRRNGAGALPGNENGADNDNGNDNGPEDEE
ncbi:MAG: undecaprenyl/decaprenyl-phosphate alpha-N-acetylglucosaminyl 1-phosphate transferase [Oscillospiraceae bacterium]|nr:undecaprenyl/decaprenyl-phosphate alpha-N-acetylglucosaminyl 1-phosphate transferase [Oscillospiraceae bacterium]